MALLLGEVARYDITIYHKFKENKTGLRHVLRTAQELV